MPKSFSQNFEANCSTIRSSKLLFKHLVITLIMLVGLECTYVHYFALPIVIKVKSLVSYNTDIDSGCVDPNN